MVFSYAPYISRHSISHGCGIMSMAFLLVFLLLMFIITILSISSWSLVSALPSKAFLSVRYGFCLYQIVV